jgi:uncharacterized membrane protein YdfJ with MMPL/SSD domain
MSASGSSPRHRGTWSGRRPWLVLLAWAVLLLASAPLALHVTRYLTAGGFDAPGSAANWAGATAGHMRPPASIPATVVAGPPSAKDLALARAAGVPAKDVPVLSGHAVEVVPVGRPARFADLLNRLRRAGAHLTAVGGEDVGSQVASDAEGTLGTSTAAALPAILLLLILVFGSLLPPLLPFVTAAAGALLAVALIAILSRYLPLSIYLLDIMSFLALGVGVDYALFISSRYRERVEAGETAAQALDVAMRTSGRSVLYSGAAVALALSTLVLGGTAYWRGLALGGAVAVGAVLLATHTLLPSLMRLMGRRALDFGRVRRSFPEWRLWGAMARWATTHSWPSLGLGLALLAAPAAFAAGIRLSIPANPAAMLPGGALLARATRAEQSVLGAGVIAPYVVAMDLRPSITQELAWSEVAAAARALGRVPGVEAVSSPTGRGVAAAALAAAARALRSDPAAQGGLRAFVDPAYSLHVVDLYVTGRAGPDTASAQALVGRLSAAVRRALPRAVRVAVGGEVAQLAAFDGLVSDRLPWILAAVAAVAFAVLLWATRSVAQALAGVLLNGLVTLATAGVLVLTVQRGAFGLLAESPNLAIVPLVLVLLFGLSMDYEVILLHRVQEALAAGRSGREAAERGIAQTGGLITGAGLIMVAVFLVLLLSPLEIMQTLGIGMTAALLLDTWVVRSFLVPALIALLGRNAFWPWRPPAQGTEAQRRPLRPPA